MEQPHQYSQDLPYAQHRGQWMDHHSYQSQHQSPIQEYNGYPWDSPPTQMNPVFENSVHQPRPSHPYLQPLITTQWPSVLATQSPYTPASQNSSATSAVQQQAPASAPPQLASSHPPSTNSTTPRRTLTDADRRRMCQYHQEHPKKKQTEIGEIFGVERSTVSKVLRQKEKYLSNPPASSSSPIRKQKPKHPDMERTVAKWVSNQQAAGISVSDDDIRKRANFFWVASGNQGDCPLRVDSPAWISKFRQRNGLGGFGRDGGTGGGVIASQREGGMAEAGGRRRGSIAHSEASVISPFDDPASPNEEHLHQTSPPPPPPPHSASDSRGHEGLGIPNAHPHHQQQHLSTISTTAGGDSSQRQARIPASQLSNNSLSSAFTDSSHATTATGGTGTSQSAATSASSPTFSPEAPHPASTPSCFPPISIPSAAPHQQRPRSNTFAATGISNSGGGAADASTSYISPPQSAEASTPKYTSTVAVFDTIGGVDAMPPPSKTPQQPSSFRGGGGISSRTSYHMHSPLSAATDSPAGSVGRGMVGPSIGEARRGLEAALAFLRANTNGAGVGVEREDVERVRRVVQLLARADAGANTGVLTLPPIGGGGGRYGGLTRIPERVEASGGGLDGGGVVSSGGDEMVLDGR